ncbi:hypothetical protein ACHAXA_010469 [Cyclostephanos tholiformis]|uniref:Uncharacterized protein n=1 Tax=Cyclostephanos tholiformis TaxID=382380 RepID=A0ABD3SFM6_9STRA
MLLARTMRIGLLLAARSRRTILGHRDGRGWASSFIVHRRLPSRKPPPPTSPFVGDVGRRRSVARCMRPASSFSSTSSSSSSSSSFEAPEPPTSHGTPVFPDIEFRRGNDNDEGVTTATGRRNADEDAIFVVSGSSRGIGLQFVIALLGRTAGKVLACCRSPSSARRLNELIDAYPDRLVVMPLDLEDQSTINDLARTIATEYRRVDVLLNVAGILGDGGRTTSGPERSISGIEREWMERSFIVNVIGPTMLTRALSPLMRTNGGRKFARVTCGGITDGDVVEVELPIGRPPTIIVNLSARVGSISDNMSGGWYSYRMSKSALNMATRTMGHELRRQGTWIVSLHPGTTDTELSSPFRRGVDGRRLFPVEFTVEKLLAVIESLDDRNTGGFYDWAGKALPF